MRTPAACKEARDAITVPADDAFAVARVTAHRSRCADCRVYAEHIKVTADAVRAAAAPGLDDIARARVTARLALAIDELATSNAQRQSRASRVRWRGLAPTAALLAAAASLLLFRLDPKKELPLQTAIKRERPAAALLAARSAAKTVEPAHPALVPGVDSGAGTALASGRLEVPAGAVVHTSVDRYTRLMLVGPARLFVETIAPQISLRLESGLLVGEYEHHAGGTLVVHSPGATTTVVGTLFAVQATAGDASRVAVRRGVVVVDSRSESIHLRAGWSWSTGELARPQIPAALAGQLAAHAVSRPEPARENRAHSGSPQPDPVTTAATATARADIPAEVRAHETAPAGAPPQQAAARPLVTADSLYAEAESAMRAGDRAKVRSQLTEVIRRFPSDGLAAAALYELARQEHATGHPAEARAYLDRLLARGGEKELREPARYLRCRLDLDDHRDAEATACLGAFRADFPASPHDAEVLALLIGLYQTRGDCRRATPLLDEYSRRYPRGPLDTLARRARCEH